MINLDGILLSYAGLLRMGYHLPNTMVLDCDTFYPAPGQGVITLQTRQKDTWIVEQCRLINDSDQERISQLELSLLEQVGFDCNLPLGLFTKIRNDKVEMKGFISDSFFTQYLEIGFESELSDVSVQVMTLSQQLLQQFKQWQ